MHSARALAIAVVLATSMFVAAPARAADPVIAAAGDIACGAYPTTLNSCQQQATSDLLMERPRDAFLALGDLQYPDGALPLFQQFYEPTWGRVKALTRPVPGNHEYRTPGAAGYFSYFGPGVGATGRAWYSFDIGTWHVIALDSNCAEAGGCGTDSPQEKWLKADLAAHPANCTLAFWHHPHFASGGVGSDDGGNNPTNNFWDDLYEGGADVILNGHVHDYERFGPQTPLGAADPAYGIREFVVGTGGRSHSAFTTLLANSERRNASAFGILELGLHRSSYYWRFVSVHGRPFTDIGSTRCHGSPSEPLLRLSARRVTRLSRAGSLRLYARCAASCSTEAQASVRIGRRTLRSVPLVRTLLAQARMKVRLKFSRRDFRAIRRALRRHRHLRGRVSALANAGGVRTHVARKTIRLRR